MNQDYESKILGEIFESSMNPEIRRESGAHFTSIENIHKAIDPLFLDDLNSEFENGDLEGLHDKISKLVFLDPACGSGNFLIETYLSLRKLEDRIIEKIGGEIRISIENFYGIEINPEAVRIARMFLNRITLGNALEIDWDSVVPRDQVSFIIGNPPYSGARVMGSQQKSDVQKIFSGWKNLGNLDYVACWFKKTSDYMRGTKIEASFISTDSVCQGESVGILWKNLLSDGIRINFAIRSFKWDLSANVFCAIIGFARFDRPRKFIDGVEVKNINAYLLDAPNVFVENRARSIFNAPTMTLGNMPNDGGNLILDEKDLEEFLEKDPRTEKFIRRIIGAREFINNIPRYCLWLADSDPDDIQSIAPIRERVEACRKYRESSRRSATRKLAQTPWLFGEIRQPSGSFIAIPEVSTSRRDYIPIGFLDSETIAKNQMRMIPNGSLALFGILTSRVHMCWIRVVASRLGAGFDYSINLVYNNFPFSKPTLEIKSTAKKILDARKNHPDSSLAELYNPESMPSDLREAHKKNDLAVLDSYGFPHDISDTEIVARLFALYQTRVRDIDSVFDFSG